MTFSEPNRVNLRRWAHRHVLLPAYETVVRRRQTFRYWRDLEQSQWMTRESLAEIQWAALRRIVQYAGERCPYYREAWSALGLNPVDLQNRSDFAHWPVIDREIARNNRGRMRAESSGMKLMQRSTSGTTGVPFCFDVDSASYDRRAAAWHRGYGWAGAEPGSRQFHLWQTPWGIHGWRSEKERLYNWLYRRRYFNVLDFREGIIACLLQEINEYQPDVIVAYAGVLHFFADALSKQKLPVYSPASIVVGAEKLHDFQRDKIEQVFQCPVFDTYGSREFNMIGAECERHQGLHLTAEHLLVEILDDDGMPVPDGEEGNVVITDLYNLGMPFIRYAIGDRAIKQAEPCPCGRGLPMLREVLGRQVDMVQSPDGLRLTGLFWTRLCRERLGLRQFQVVQKEPHYVQFRAVTGEAWTSQDQLEIETRAREVLGPTVRFEFQRVNEIPLTSAGKYRVVLNSCDSSSSARPRETLLTRTID
jgi:phenylacetate-CoA ligase